MEEVRWRGPAVLPSAWSEACAPVIAYPLLA